MLWTKITKGFVLSVIGGLLMPALAYAAQSASTNYQVNEVFFGSGGSLNSCSTNYCSKQSAGELTVGNPSSPNYQAHAGFNTDRSPYLQLIVNGSSSDIGKLTSGTTKTANTSFSVKTYLASGYVVQTLSSPPTNNSYTMQALTTPTASNANSEQFGMNLVANTSPATFGVNPVQVPDASFASGAAASGYNTPNLFKYVTGDTIASANKSSGETDYTISYIFNISNVTPAGTYIFNQVLVATSTF